MIDKYSGADWIEKSLKMELSPLGKEVADILGQVWKGIYHLQKPVQRVDWSNKTWIEITIYGSLSTFDFDDLTRLVVLCHDRMIRMSIDARAFNYLRLMFHQRDSRDGDIYTRMPTMENHIEIIRKDVSLGEK